MKDALSAEHLAAPIKERCLMNIGSCATFYKALRWLGDEKVCVCHASWISQAQGTRDVKGIGDMELTRHETMVKVGSWK